MGEKTLDVYRDWLGIKDTNRPLNYYQLLRVKLFEDDVAKIRQHYRKLNAHVRKFATGQYWEESQKLLNELARAMLTLTDQKRKAEYDASLGRRESAPGAARTLEQILVARGVLTPQQLEKARNYAMVVGVEVRDAICQQKLAPAEAVMQAYAESQGLPYVDLKEMTLDEALLQRFPALVARQHSCVPVLKDEGTLVLASPNPLPPEVEEELRLRLGVQVRVAICTPAAVHQVIHQYYPKEKAQSELASLDRPGPKTAAKAPTSPRPKQTLSEEERRQRWLLTAALAMLSFSAVSLYRSVFRGLGLIDSLWPAVLTAVVVGGVSFWFLIARHR